MFCPQCGKECGDNEIFCLSCGSRLDANQMNGSSSNANPYTQNFQNMSNDFSTPAFMSSGSAEVVESKRSSSVVKKSIIIALIALLVALLGVFGFIFIKNRLERKYLSDNPTKYVFSSYQTFFNNSGTEDNDIFAVLNNCEEKGNIGVSTELNGNDTNAVGSFSSDMQFSYNVPENKYYFKSNFGAVPNDTSSAQNILFELYSNIDRVDFNFNLPDKSGQYYIEPGKIREQAENSIFSPAKDNVLNVTQEQFNTLIERVEEMYSKLSNGDSSKNDLEGLFDNIIKKIEQDCNVTVDEGNTTVNGSDVAVDTVTYTFDYNAIVAICNDVKTEFLNYLSENKDKIENYDEYRKKVEESADELISSITESSQAKNMVIVVKNHMRKDNNEIAKLEFEFKNSSSNSANVKLTLEFSRDPYMNIKITGTSGIFTASATLYKEVKDGTVSYVLSADLNKGGNTESQEIARLDYDDANGKLKLTFGGNSYVCDVKKDKNSVEFSFDIPVNSSYGTPSGSSVSIKIGVSSEPEMNTINAQKNLFGITKEEYENVFSPAESPSIPSIAGNNGMSL